MRPKFTALAYTLVVFICGCRVPRSNRPIEDPARGRRAPKESYVMRVKATSSTGLVDYGQLVPSFTFHPRPGGLSENVGALIETQIRASSQFSTSEGEYEVGHVETDPSPSYVTACKEQMEQTFRDGTTVSKRTMDSWEDDKPTGREYRVHTGIWSLPVGDEMHCFHVTIANQAEFTSQPSLDLFLENPPDADNTWETDEPFPDGSELEGKTETDKFQSWMQTVRQLNGVRWLEMVGAQSGSDIIITHQGKMHALYITKT